MDIYWLGQACFKIKGKQASVIIDPFTPETVGLKLPKDLEADIVLETHDHPDHNNIKSVSSNAMAFYGPGEYEVKGVVVTGIAAFHDDVNGQQRGANTIYSIVMDGLNIVHLGDLGQSSLTQEQITQMGEVDILMVPVGGVYTIDSKTAANIIAAIEPKIILPMHYGFPELKIALDPVANFLKEMGKENLEVSPKLSITKDKLPDEPEVVLLKLS